MAASRRLLVVGGGASAADALATWLRVRRPDDRAWIPLRSPLRALPHWILGVDVHYLTWLPEHLPAHPIGPRIVTRDEMLGLAVPRAIRSGVIELVPGVEGDEPTAVRTTGGRRLEPDLPALATGFHATTPHLGALVEHHPGGWPLLRRRESRRTPRSTWWGRASAAPWPLPTCGASPATHATSPAGSRGGHEGGAGPGVRRAGGAGPARRRGLELQAGQVAIEVRACGLNWADPLQRQGIYPGGPRPSFLAGQEAAGIVVVQGPGVIEPALGARVAVVASWGMHAERAVVPAASRFVLPPALSWEEGAAVPVHSSPRPVRSPPWAGPRPARRSSSTPVAGAWGPWPSRSRAAWACG